MDPKKYRTFKVYGEDLAVYQGTSILSRKLRRICDSFTSLYGTLVFIGYTKPFRVDVVVDEKIVELPVVVLATNRPENIDVIENMGTNYYAEPYTYKDFYVPLGMYKGVVIGYRRYGSGKKAVYVVDGFKVYSVYGTSLPAGESMLMFLRTLFYKFDGWRLTVWRHGEEEAYKMLQARYNSLKRRLRSGDASVRPALERIAYVLRAFESGKSELFRVTLTLIKRFNYGVFRGGEPRMSSLKTDRLERIYRLFTSFEKEINDELKQIYRPLNYGITWWVDGSVPQLATYANPFVGAKFIATSDLIAIYYPFAVKNYGSSGIFFGVSETGYMVVVNPFEGLGYNFIVTGTTGSGKSFLLKRMIYILLKLFDREAEEHGAEKPKALIIDPQHEYLGFSKYTGMHYIDIEEKTRLGLDPFRMATTPIEELGRPLITDIEAVYMMGDVSSLNDYEVAVLMRVFRDLRRERGEDAVIDVYEVIGRLERSGGVDEKRVADKLNKAVVSYDFIFSGDFELYDRVVYGFRFAEEKVKEMIMRLVVMPYWRYFTSRMAGTKLIGIDEVQVLLERGYTAEKIAEMYAQSRKYTTATITATQSPLVYFKYGEKYADQILMNSFYKVFLAIPPDQIREVALRFDIPEPILRRYCMVERGERPVPGRGVLEAFTTIIPFRYEADEWERILFGSKEEEVRKLEKILKRMRAEEEMRKTEEEKALLRYLLGII